MPKITMQQYADIHAKAHAMPARHQGLLEVSLRERRHKEELAESVQKLDAALAAPAAVGEELP